MSLVPVRCCASTYVQSNRPHMKPCRSSRLPVGIWFEITTGMRCEYFSYLNFDLPPLGYHEKITSAQLVLTPVPPFFFGSPPATLHLQALRDGFRDCHTDYRSRPKGIPCTDVVVNMPLHPNPVIADVTDIVTGWESGVLANRGLVLFPEPRSSHNGIWIFASPCYPHFAYQPMLNIYTDRQCHASSIAEECDVVDQERFSCTREVWCFSIWTFIVRNTGSLRVRVGLQDSPDGVEFFDDGPEIEVAPGELVALVNQYFARFCRVKHRLADGGAGEGRIALWLQGRQD